jgi:hypothetical protein
MSTENNVVENNSQEIIGEETVSVYDGMNEVFNHTRQIIDMMKQGEKIAIRDLADKVAAQVEMSSGNVMGLVQLFCKKSKEVSVEVGRGGGVFKGGKPKRIDNRPRCSTCNQVVRSELQKHKAEMDESSEEISESL